MRAVIETLLGATLFAAVYAAALAVVSLWLGHAPVARMLAQAGLGMGVVAGALGAALLLVAASGRR